MSDPEMTVDYPFLDPATGLPVDADGNPLPRPDYWDEPPSLDDFVPLPGSEPIATEPPAPVDLTPPMPEPYTDDQGNLVVLAPDEARRDL